MGFASMLGVGRVLALVRVSIVSASMLGIGGDLAMVGTWNIPIVITGTRAYIVGSGTDIAYAGREGLIVIARVETAMAA